MTADLIQRLKNIVEGDHSRGCQGREYECTCGFDHETLLAIKEAIVVIERLQNKVTPMKADDEGAGTLSDDFSKEPPSLAAVRATKARDCTLWSPRDALLDILRDIDSGAIGLESVFIGFERKDKPGVCGYCVAGSSPIAVIGAATSALKAYMDAGQ